MLRSAFNILYGMQPMSFRVQGSPEDGVRRLLSVVNTAGLGMTFREALVGKVSRDRVVIRRYRPWMHNDFAPRFVGAFIYNGADSKLVGGFRLGTFTRIFMTIWFGFMIVWTIAATFAVVSKPNGEASAAFLPLAGVGMFTLGLAMVRLFAWMSRSDIAHITEAVMRALEGNHASG